MTHSLIAAWFNFDWQQLVTSLAGVIVAWLAGVFLPPGRTIANKRAVRVIRSRDRD